MSYVTELEKSIRFARKRIEKLEEERDVYRKVAHFYTLDPNLLWTNLPAKQKEIDNAIKEMIKMEKKCRPFTIDVDIDGIHCGKDCGKYTNGLVTMCNQFEKIIRWEKVGKGAPFCSAIFPS